MFHPFTVENSTFCILEEMFSLPGIYTQFTLKSPPFFKLGSNKERNFIKMLGFLFPTLPLTYQHTSIQSFVLRQYIFNVKQ
jgi:hypothetical protein